MRFLKPILIITITLSFIFIGCSKKNDQLIIGKWKIDDITAPQPNFEAMPDSLKQFYKSQLEIKNNLILATGYYEFIEDEQCFFEVDGEKFEGKWRLSDDLNTLYTKEKGGTTEETFEIKDLTESVFTIESTVGGNTRRIVMKKQVD